MAILISFLTILVLSLPEGNCTQQVKYVHPSDRISACTSEPCTIDQFAQNSEEHFLSNVIFIFFPGDHQLNNNISFHGVHNISFHASMPTNESVAIRLGPQGSLSFDKCDDIKIVSLNFLLSENFEYGLMLSETNVTLNNITLFPEDGNSTGCSAIVSQASTISISNSSFVGITGKSGAVLLALDSEITFTGSNSFSGNSANLGGAIHSVGSTLQFTGTVTFINNLAILNENNTQLVCSSNAVNNDTYGMGGAIFAQTSDAIISSCARFMHNKAIIGGAITVMDNSTLVIDGFSCLNQVNALHQMTVLFDGNSATAPVAFEYISISTRIIDEFILGSGGAIFTYDSVINIINISLTNNFSPGGGGAAYFIQSDITLYNINVVNNSAGQGYFYSSGGAILFQSCKKVFIDGSNNFINNSALDSGGAIGFYMIQLLKFGGTNLFEGNLVLFNAGGALYINTAMTIFISGYNMFKRNLAFNGGAVYVYNASQTVQFGVAIYSLKI